MSTSSIQIDFTQTEKNILIDLCSDIPFQTNYIWVDYVQITISQQTMSKQAEILSLDKLCPDRLCSDKLCSNRLCLIGKQENQNSPTKAYLDKLVRIDQQN